MASGAGEMTTPTRSPHFFKVFFPHLSSRHLKIPPAFWKHMEGETPRTLSLKGPSGSTWQVGLIKNLSGMWFDSGWENFVTDHSLSLGDFLVFRYDGGSNFTVMIFDDSSCEKEGDSHASQCTDMIVFRGSEEVIASQALVFHPECAPRAISNGKRKRERALMMEGPFRNKKYNPLDNVMEKHSQTLLGHANLEKSNSSPDVWIHPKSGALVMPQGSITTTRHRSTSQLQTTSDEFCPEKDLNYVAKELKSQSGRGGDFKSSPLSSSLMPQRQCMAEQGANTSRRQSFSKKQISSSETSASKRLSKAHSKCLSSVKNGEIHQPGKVTLQVLRVGSLMSQRRPVTKEEMDKALEMAKSFKSNKPFVAVVMQDSYVYNGFFMNIPWSFAKEHLPKSGKITLWDPNGEQWTITYISYNNHGGFSAGWGKFSYAHNLEKGDICIFELIKKNNMRVHFFRVLDELTPLMKICKTDC